MAYWLVKSEPGDWSWQDQCAVDKEPWDGVRNYQAQKHMRAMLKGDEVFFYHSGKSRQIVGICTVETPPYPDPDDPNYSSKSGGRFVLVDLKKKKTLPRPITLQAIKQDENLAHLALVRQSRLSVMPIDPPAWDLLLKMAGL